MPGLELETVVAAYSQPTYSAIAAAEYSLIQAHWLRDLIPLAIQAYPAITRSAGRSSILSRVLKTSRGNPQIFDLAVAALNDRSYIVREHACSILAYSLNSAAIPHLQSLAEHKDEKTRADAAAAIDAISNQNHHLFVDRAHTGSTRWLVNPVDMA